MRGRAVEGGDCPTGVGGDGGEGGETGDESGSSDLEVCDGLHAFSVSTGHDNEEGMDVRLPR